MSFRKNKNHKKSKVLFINRFYWPDESATSQLLSDLAEHLASNGVNVTVVTSRLRYASPKQSLPAIEHHNGVEIRRVWTTAFDRSSLAGRMLDFLTFYLFATFALIRLTDRQDVVVAKTDPPLIQLFAWFATRLKRARLINWCQDLFPEVAFALAKSHSHDTLRSALHEIRNFALKRSYMNVTISSEMRDTLLTQGINRNRVIVINNWCGQSVEPVPKESNTLREQWQIQDDFVLGYSGNLGRAHVPDKIFALAKELVGIPKLKMLFIGSGHGMAWLQERCEAEQFDHVLFEPYQPRESLSISLSVPDMHLISLKSECQRFLAPSKFYGILAVGRPVAFLGDPQCELAQEVHRSRFGLTLPLNRTDDWRSAICDVIDDEDGLTAMGHNARKAYDERFKPSTSLSAWQEVLQKAPSLLQTSKDAEIPVPTVRQKEAARQSFIAPKQEPTALRPTHEPR